MDGHAKTTDDLLVADLLSDTVTLPCEGMRDAMRNAVVGDDVYREDSTAAELERYAANLLGKEAALFVLSGTMGNLIAACVHASKQPFPEIVLGRESHVARDEVGGISMVARSATRQLAVDDSGAFHLDEVQSILQEEPDVHCASTCAIFLEDSHGFLGGKCLPLFYPASLRELRARLHREDVAIHCDGARLWNAAIARSETPAQAAKDFDSVSCCLSKGLCAPMGSVLAGSHPFVDHARKVRKMLGGGTRQVGIMAAAGLYALQNNLNDLGDDHKRALEFAEALRQSAPEGTVLVDTPETNIVLFQLHVGFDVRRDLVNRSLRDGVRIGLWGRNKVRAVLHRSVPKNAHLKAAAVISQQIKSLLK
jgi:threonine aldolase